MKITLEDIDRAMKDETVNSMLLSEVAAICEVSYEKAEAELMRQMPSFEFKPRKIDGDYVFEGKAGKGQVLIMMMELSPYVLGLLTGDTEEKRKEREEALRARQLAEYERFQEDQKFYHSLSKAEQEMYNGLCEKLLTQEAFGENTQVTRMRIALFKEMCKEKAATTHQTHYEQRFTFREARTTTRTQKATRARPKKPRKAKKFNTENCADLGAMFGI
ncbi:hypothetical protein A4L30_10675 [Salmonella enterica subsp. enterica serovar Bovismorbificans]|nr:hypothetical protein [Salmonella enterica subsp. enterica serovar Bovismorbificans]